MLYTSITYDLKASRHGVKATKPPFWFHGTDRLKRMLKNAEQMLLIVSVKLLKCSGSLGSGGNCCCGPFIVAFLLIQQGLFSSGKPLSFDLWQSATVIISALFHQVWSQFFRPGPPHVLLHTHTRTHIFLPPETYSSLLLLRQVHYKHRLLGNTQTERNF